jgi:hypothetical protein
MHLRYAGLLLCPLLSWHVYEELPLGCTTHHLSSAQLLIQGVRVTAGGARHVMTHDTVHVGAYLRLALDTSLLASATLTSQLAALPPPPSGDHSAG